MITPYNDAQESKTGQVRRMFDRIAPTYDKLNRIISLGMDISWRKRAIEMLRPYSPTHVLDVATGTGDLAIDLVHRLESIKQVHGVDISQEMMRHGEAKVYSLELDDRIRFSVEDCTALSLADASYDAVTIGFGIRNFEDIPKALKELHRILQPGKPLVILELSEPRNALLRMGYKLYSGYIVPLIGKMLSDDQQAYSYLPKSIAAMPQREAMVELMLQAGFSQAYYRDIMPQTCCVYVAVK